MSSELYTPAWHEWHSSAYNEWSTRALFGVFAHLGVPRRLLDVGCADGHLVLLGAKMGIYSKGIDIAVEEYDPFLLPHDLTQPFLDDKQRDLVISWEVAEHLPAEAADTFCDTLVNNLEAGGHLVFTAAIPGQGGTGHINEQPHAYWREKFLARGLKDQYGLTEALHATWLATTGPCWWYPQNVKVYSR